MKNFLAILVGLYCCIGHIFAQSISGTIKQGQTLINKNGEYVGVIASMEDKGETLPDIPRGQRVAMAIKDAVVGKHFDEGDELYVDVPEKHYKFIEREFKDKLTEDEFETLYEFLEKVVNYDYFYKDVMHFDYTPTLEFPDFDIHLALSVMPSAFTIAFLAGIESLLSATVVDGMSGDNHNSNAELIGEGIANIASAMFMGVPATGAIARTATNYKANAYSPMSAIMQSVFLLLFMLILSPWHSLFLWHVCLWFCLLLVGT